jgi:hypothetical protein
MPETTTPASPRGSYGEVIDQPDVFGLGALTICEHDLGTNYRPVMEWSGPRATRTVLAAAERAGMVHPATAACPRSHAAVLDLLDADGDIVDDRCIPTPEAWAWWCRAVEFRPSSSDCCRCSPDGWSFVYGAGA